MADDYDYGLDDSDSFNGMLAKTVSPISAAEIVGPPPDAAPASQPGVSTQRTGNLAAAPKQAVAKNQDTAIGRAQYTGVSRPANDGFGATTSVQPAAAQPIQSAQPVRPAQGVQPAQPIQAAQPIQPAQVNPDPTSSLRPGGTSPMPALPQAGLQPVQGPSQLDKDQSRLSMLTNTGSGVSQIQNPFLRGLARVGDVAGSILAPGVAAAIPGTTLHHQQLLGQQQQIVSNDQGQQQAAATLQDTTQQAGQRAAKAQQDIADASRDALRNPTAKEADLYNLDPEAQYRPTELGRLAIEANKSAKPDSVNGMYAAAVQDAIQNGRDPGKDPKVQQLADSITSIQKPTATKAEQRDDRAIEILSKPPAQRTPGENAYMTGYNQWVKETKVDPGTARMSVLLQQPIAAADPNNPGGEKFVTKKDAIGMGAPGGVDTTAPKALVKDFTSGADAKTLNAFNTAQDHLRLLGQAADALHNGNTQLVNQFGNAYAAQTGSPAPTNFNAVKAAVAGEISKTFKGGGATDAEIAEINKTIQSKNSPAQLRGAINQYSALMQSKRAALQTQYQQGMKGKPNFGKTPATAAPAGSGGGFNWDSHPLVTP
jgi:hypothetical protein